ncbi:hypothetical protein ACER0A_001200 [Haloimpatiens sp. FM7315]|uniref:hypothetical protein n=1 Tax=Haloimpatiens sp. FM7315 TaxID=3298609 RepID=UPI00370B84D1
MFKKINFILMVLVSVLLINSLSVINCKASENVTIDKLINSSKKYNNKLVEISAEAIGEPMVRGNMVWINVNDGTSAIGIWSDKKVLNEIKTFGNYHNKGDKIKVIGVFSFNCKEHGGDVDIHSKDIKLIERGHKITRPISEKKEILALGLVIILMIIAAIYYKVVR